MSTWVDLGDLYVKKAGDTVSGSILMANNNLSVAYDSDTTYNVGTEIKSLRNSVSSINKKVTGEINKDNICSIYYCCHHNIGIASVLISLQKNYTTAYKSHYAAGTVSTGYAPDRDWASSGTFNSADVARQGYIYINNAGQICYALLGGTFSPGDQIRGNLVWYYS